MRRNTGGYKLTGATQASWVLMRQLLVSDDMRCLGPLHACAPLLREASTPSCARPAPTASHESMATVLAVASPGLEPGALVRVLCGRGYVLGRALARAHAQKRGRTTNSVTLSFVVQCERVLVSPRTLATRATEERPTGASPGRTWFS